VKKGWEVRKLGEVLQKTETVNPLQTPDAEFQYIDVSSVSNLTFQIEKTQLLLGKNAPSRARRLVKSDDVLFATIRPTLKRIALVPSYLDNQVCSTGYFVLRPKVEVDHRFVFYYLFTENFLSQMEKLQKGASYPAVTDGDVRSQKIPFPPLPEQKRIVGILDEAFAGIAKAKENTQKNLQNARELYQSYLQRVFSNPGDGWKEKTLAQIALEFGRGKSKHRPRGDIRLLGGKYPLIQTGEISISAHWITDYLHTYNDQGLAQSKLWPQGTVCVAIVGANVAESAILGFDACFPDSVIGIVVNDQVANNEYVEFLLQSFKVLLKEKGKGTARDNINMGTFKNQKFPFPPVEEQKAIALRINALTIETQRLEALYQQKLANLEELKQSLLQKAFAGELT